MRSYSSPKDFGQFDTIQGFVTNCSRTPDDIQKQRQLARMKLNISSDVIVITSIGTIIRRKQQHWLVDFYEQYAANTKEKKLPKIKILLVGGSDSRNKSEDEYEKVIWDRIAIGKMKDNVVIIPKMANPSLVTVASDLHVSAATHEAFPLNTIEMMCMGVPTMMTPAFGCQEQITQSGFDGILLPSTRSYEAFSLAMYKALNDLSELKQIGIQGRETVSKYFTESRVIPRFQSLVTKLQSSSSIFVESGHVCMVLQYLNHNNYSSLIRNTIKSFIEQTFIDWEILLYAGDGIEEASLYPILLQYNAYSIRFLRNKSGITPSGVRNFRDEAALRLVYIHHSLYYITGTE